MDAWMQLWVVSWLLLLSWLFQVWCRSASLVGPSLSAAWLPPTSVTSPPPSSASCGLLRHRAPAASTSCEILILSPCKPLLLLSWHMITRSWFTEPRLASLLRVSTASFLKRSFAHFHSPAGLVFFFYLPWLETSSDSLSLWFSLLVIYSLALIISQNAISSCCWRSTERRDECCNSHDSRCCPIHSHNVAELSRSSPKTNRKLTKFKVCIFFFLAATASSLCGFNLWIVT